MRIFRIMRAKVLSYFFTFLAVLSVELLLPCTVLAAAPTPNLPTLPIPAINMAVGSAQNAQDVVQTLQIVALITVLSMAPAILLMLTSFTRILVVMGFVRSAIGLQQTPPNQVLTSLALFLTIFTMTPVWTQIYDQALVPYMQGSIQTPAAWERTVEPVREFMFRQTRERELSLMVRLSGDPQPANQSEVRTIVLIPAYVLSELKTAFQMGVVIYIPFIVIDMIVASILMSMGMMMLPPSMISLPFKILLFVMADGWSLIIASLVTSFN
ncbi:MAG: flagellar type III secretion system pore protein FliP [Synergistaceae bacterium]|jgi:flagellar biosynthetic protein FliP|nr:flagellar type III secretion system pore protein FliP [Synergistaceae bacterium]